MRGRWLFSVLVPAAGLVYACGSFDGAESGGGPEVPAEGGGPEAAADVAPIPDGGQGVSCAISVFSDAPPDARCLGPTMSPVDLASSPMHCGRCGHDCQGASCAGGLCMPVNVFGAGTAKSASLRDISADHAYFLSGPDVQRVGLVSGNVDLVARTTRAGAYMQSVVRDGDQLFVTDHIDNSTDIGTVPSITASVVDGGGAITPLLSTSGDGIVADSTHLYIVDYASLYKVKRTSNVGREAIQLNQEQTFAILGPVSHKDVLYWIRGETISNDGGPLTRQLFARNATTGTVLMRSDQLGAPTALAVDDTHVYFTDSSTKRIMRVLQSGTSAPTVVAEWPRNDAAVKALLVDGDYVYVVVTNDLQSGAAAVIYRAPKCAGPADARVIVATIPGSEYAGNLLADAKFLYYGGNNGLWRVAK